MQGLGSRPTNKVKQAMSNENNHEDVSNPQKQTGHSESRRRFARLGLAALVVLSLVSKPVLGAQCLSNMMSGNLSDPNRGTCSKGVSPGGWKNPGGSVLSYTTLAAWSAAGYDYGALPEGADASHVRSYTGGATASTAPFNTLLTGVPADKPLRLVLKESPGSLNAGIIAAYLNAKLSAISPGTSHYVLTPAQVESLVLGPTPLPSGYSTLKDFLYTTW